MGKMLDNIKALCKMQGLTLKQLEKDLNFSNKTLFSWDSHKPSIEKVEAVANYFGVSLDYICGRTENTEFHKLKILFSSLNEEGQEKIIEFAEMLDASGKYKKHDQFEVVEKKA